jgi:hypothetical protein
VITLMGGLGYVNWRQACCYTADGKNKHFSTSYPEPNSTDAHIVIWEMKLWYLLTMNVTMLITLCFSFTLWLHAFQFIIASLWCSTILVQHTRMRNRTGCCKYFVIIDMYK